MGKYKITRKQLLKEPDEFITFSGKTISFFRTHRKLLSVTVGVFFAVIVGLATYRYLNTRWEDAASLGVQDVVSQYEKALADGQSPVQALTGIETAMADLLGRYGSQSAGHLGRLFYADAKLAAGNFAEAISLYRETLGYFGATSFFHYRILESVAQAHIALKQYDQAVTALQQIADGTGAGMADAAFFQMGLVFNATGNTARRDDAFRSLSEKYPDSQYVELITAKTKAG
ncbi:MAG: tetratricopeptide repeat protein [Pseudomonadota bacterium]